jgi:hypothetical protein
MSYEATKLLKSLHNVDNLDEWGKVHEAEIDSLSEEEACWVRIGMQCRRWELRESKKVPKPLPWVFGLEIEYYSSDGRMVRKECHSPNGLIVRKEIYKESS